MSKLSERFKQFQKDREVKAIKAELDEYNADEEEAVRLEAEAARAERNLKAKKRLESATCRIQAARAGHKKFRESRKCSKGTGLGDLLWPKAKPKKGKKKAGPSFMDDLLGRGPPPKKRSRKKDSFLDGLF